MYNSKQKPLLLSKKERPINVEKPFIVISTIKQKYVLFFCAHIYSCDYCYIISTINNHFKQHTQMRG